ncbi:MAG TPA: two-component regulator propeller domain-containing protein, partial [Draconibacterium sp.]|nr:two-component regulator propeller domain-containing protein [Draconibacterium sp.]
TGTFTHYMHDPINPNSLINNKVSAIFEDSKGTFWIGTAGDGLHTLDREKGTFTRHTYDPKHPEKLSRPPFDNLSEEFKRIEFITFIHEDATGAIWIATLHAGLNYYDPKTGKTTYLESAKYFNNDYDGGTPWQAYTSRDGVVWISSLTGFLYGIDPFKNKIPHFVTSIKHVISFYEEPNGTLWMLNDNELIREDKTKGIIKREVIDENPSTIIERTLKIIKEDLQGTVWFGSKDGLFRWNKKNESFSINYKINPNNKYSSGNNVWTIYEDRKANFWIGKARGLSLLNRETGSATEFLIYPNDTSEFGKNSITSILEDKTGKLWIGTWYGGGLYQFNMETKEFKNMLNEKDVSCIFEDTDGILWVSCMDNLYKYDRSADNFIPYTDANSLSGITNIVSIVEDNQKYLWFGTWNNTIVTLNPQRNTTIVYDKNHGVENGLVFHSAYKGRNGYLYFGDETGYFLFDPEEFTRNSLPPNIVFTDFLLADETVKPGNGSPLKESILQTKEILLNFNQNVFSFEFVALNYSNPEETKYSCMLENYDSDWRKGNSERRAYYFNVPPGKYVFRVKALTSNGVWAEKKIDVIILPPWWLTWWAYCIYGLLFIAFVFAIDRFQRRRLLKAEKERNRERELAQAKEIEKAYLELGKAHETLKSTQAQLIQSEKMASLGELTAGIAHEIQNPLNFVNNFSEVSNELIDEMKEELATGNQQLAIEIADDIKQNLEKINHHGKRADAIVKGMLQHSRTSTGQKELTDINKLADEYLRLAYHGLRAKDKSFYATMKTDFDSTIGKIEVIPQDIGRVILNLITNAFYADNEKKQSNNEGYEPVVSVGTKKVGNKVEIKVSDNGNGIPKELKDKIFQPFFTTKPTGQGTGLGLSLSYDIVKAHGGELKVETKEGEGSEFTIWLPVL